VVVTVVRSPGKPLDTLSHLVKGLIDVFQDPRFDTPRA
jgi:hypothetical protein